LFDDLKARPDTLLLVKSDKVKDLVRAMPASVEFVTRGKPGAVTVGRVRQRTPLAALQSSCTAASGEIVGN